MMNNACFRLLLFTCLSGCGLSCMAQQGLVQLAGEAQGTTYHIAYLDAGNRDLQWEIDSILQDFDKSVSTYLPTSIISRINANEPNVVPDTYFITCFTKAKEIWRSTNGAFDPTVYPLVNAWGFGPGEKKHIDQHLIDSLMTFVGFDKIDLVNGRIVKQDPRVALDFNAFAQGYSVDVIAGFLLDLRITDFIVEIGGEVYANGKQSDGEPWTIGIEQPVDNQTSGNPLEAVARLESLGVATSGNYRRFIVENGVKYAHHIDPKTGYPTKNNLLSATVFAPDCISADANATGILVMGLEAAKIFLAKHTELQVFLIYSDENGNYRYYQTAGVAGLLTD